MRKTLIKICGFSELSPLLAALDAQIDFVGFVFFEKSPRNLSLQQAAELGEAVEGRAKTVALTVNASLQEIEGVAAALNPDFIQLHGAETPACAARIKKAFGIPLMKAIGVENAEDIKKSALYEESVDYLLFDAKPPKDASRPGGNGQAFDWTILQGFSSPRPWLLSGGLTACTVGNAIMKTAPTGVDASSGVESAPGVKDPAAIRAFIQAVRAADDRKIAS